MTTQETRLAEIRSAIEAENVSYGELAELQDIAAKHPELFADDPLLAEAAGIPEKQWQSNADRTRKAGRILCDYSPGETARTGLVDLLADSLHIFGEDEVRFILDRALIHYNAEKGGAQ
jgi:hypothetical protein